MSEDFSTLIPASMVRQFHFCPRIVYFTLVEGVRERVTESMLEGQAAYQDELRREERRKTLLALRRETVSERHLDLYLRSERLGLEGQLDLLAKTSRGYLVVEYKWAEKPKRKGRVRHHIYQTAAYAALVEDVLGLAVTKIAIYYGLSRELVELAYTPQLKQHVLWTLKKIKRIIERGELPPPRTGPKCKGCGYYSVCRLA